MARVKKSRKNDPSYRSHRSNAPDTQLVYPLARVTPAGAPAMVLLEASRLLSGYNHRLYRQHGNYRLKIDLRQGADQTPVSIYTLANTWFVKRSIQTAKQMHDKAMEEERAMGSQARWYDFRIQPHDSAGAAWENLHPSAAATPQSTPSAIVPGGEYQYSIVRDTSANDKVFSMFGSTTTSQWNIFTEYDNTANVSNDPASAITTGAYDELDGNVESANYVRLNDHGNEPPYSSTTHPSGLVLEHRQLFRTATNQVTSTGFIDAPLGLVWINVGSGQSPPISVEFAKGTYKGVRMEAY